MARLISAFFNGGVLYQPKAVKWVGKDDKQVYQFTPEVNGRLKAKEQNIALIRSALIGVVNEPGGTGSRSRIKTGALWPAKQGRLRWWRWQGKTGPEGGGTPPDFNDHAWFVAIASADKPEIAVAVLVENGGHGGSAAAPMARRCSSLLRQMNISPQTQRTRRRRTSPHAAEQFKGDRRISNDE